MNAKEQVLQWVRKANPQTIDYHPGDKLKTSPQYMTMGLQELLISLEDWTEVPVDFTGTILTFYLDDGILEYQLTKNLHQQPDPFYEYLVPLIDNDSW